MLEGYDTVSDFSADQLRWRGGRVFSCDRENARNAATRSSERPILSPFDGGAP